MNVLVLPSWYGHRCHPLHGTFVLEQAAALAELRPSWNVGLSYWGQGLGRLSSDHLRTSPRCLLDALRLPRAAERTLAPNQIEFRTRALSWNEAWRHGNRDGILGANRRILARAIERFGGVDVLHAHVSYPAGWVAMRLSDETGIPYVVTEHMGPFPLPVYRRADGSPEPYVREPLERAHARMAVSSALCATIAGFGIPEPEYVPNLIDERLYRHEPHPADAPFTFFTLGGMEPVKGWPDLLQAIAALIASLEPAERERVRFRLGGYGPMLERYRAQARGLEIERWIEWLGFLPRERAREEFHRCDAYVLASLHESFGITLVETLATGHPVIATRCGGPESLVTPENGLLVDVGRPDQLAAAMRTLLRGEFRYHPAAIRDAVLKQFSRPVIVDRLEAVYRRVAPRALPT